MNKILMHKSKVVADMFIADTFINRFMGYMFRREAHHEAIMIKPCNSIHTFFMKFSIDVLFINENMKIIKKIESLKPGKIIFPVKDAAMIIEGKEGMFKDIRIGDEVKVRLI